MVAAAAPELALPDFSSDSGAIFSRCEKYRWRLWRRVNAPGALRVLFIMLNPSTADAKENDPTIRRCINFARAWGYSYLDVCNLFAWRSTSPSVLKHVGDPTGRENDLRIRATAERAHLVVCAWGKDGKLLARGARVRRELTAAGVKLYHLGLNDDGTPKHPLYLSGKLKPELWTS